MTPGASRPVLLSSCCQCAGRPAAVLDTVSASNIEASLVGQRRAGRAGDGAHTHMTTDGDCLVVRPVTNDSQEVAR
ncbi:hypothetical protein ACH4UT_32045 [Streptomyces sp. NPDC020799]|uniref:hypothetical protein n=1 Tax=Streptomyces sp. NPDC020799 TaxID=3365091 RepID=UPI00378A4744